MSLFGGKKRDEAPEAVSSEPNSPRAGAGTIPPDKTESGPRAATAAERGGKSVASIGKSILFKGELSGDEDLVVDGMVEGRIQLPNHELTIGTHARVTAEVSAKQVVVVGHVLGNVTATERIEIQSTGVVEGDLRAPKLLVQEGAVVNGAIEMTSVGSSTTPARPEAAAAAARKAG